jgi:AbiV family abortive infection protein
MSKLTLQQLDDGIDAALANSSSLIAEAKLLLQSGFQARAYTLSHIAREEIAKTTMLYTAGLRMLAEHSVDWSRLHKRLRDHKAKLTSDALVAYVNAPEASGTLPLEAMLFGTGVRNEWKNDSLYIAFKETAFRTPSEMITPKKAERTIGLAILALEDAKHYLFISGKLTQRSPEEVKKTFAHIKPGKVNPDETLARVKHLARVIRVAKEARRDKQDPVV